MRMVFSNKSCNEGHKECNQMTHEMAAASTPTGVVLTHCEEGAAGCAAGVAAIEAREQDRMMKNGAQRANRGPENRSLTLTLVESGTGADPAVDPHWLVVVTFA